MARPLLFAVWTVGASLVLLEVGLQVAARFAAPVAGEAQELKPDDDAFRILALGDSWVAGAEAPEGKGFVDGLATRLPGKVAGGRVQILNRGRTGANSAHVALEALDHGPTFRPHLYLVLVGQNNASNFARVAEVEERLGGVNTGPRILDRLRTVKLARIALANARGSSGYGRRPLPTVPDAAHDPEGRLAATDPRLRSGIGESWYLGRPLTLPIDAADPREALAWTLLELIRQRDALLWDKVAEQLADRWGWQAYVGALPAPRADGSTPVRTIPIQPRVKDPVEALSRYALLRWARERLDWRAVRLHGSALLVEEPGRDFFTDLGGAEAALLAGDWRRARALLVAAHRRGPGSPDVVDLALRFPPAARDTETDEAAEAEPAGTWTALQHHRKALGTFDWERSRAELERWMVEAPYDEQSRATLAVQQAVAGELEAARATIGQVGPPPDDLSGPIRSVSWLRYALIDIGESGDRERVKVATDAAIGLLFARYKEGIGAPDEAALRGREVPSELLSLIVQLRGEHGYCDGLPVLADRAFIARGDAGDYARLLRPCLDPGEIERRLDILRPAWAPIGEGEGFRALVRAGHQPFQLLHRDLDLVLGVAQRGGARVVLLSYPNPSEDHRTLRDVAAEYAATRSVEFIDLHKSFESRYDATAWAALLGPNGHCNEAGYAQMADDLVAEFDRRGLLTTKESP